MEREAWKWILPFVRRAIKPLRNRRFTFESGEIVLVLLWSVLHDRPVYWACDPRNWPDEFRPPRLPSPSTMTRRQRKPVFRECLLRLLAQLRRGKVRPLLNMIDGKALPISSISKDPDARFGRGAGGLVKGYKLHLILAKNNVLQAHDVRPMNCDERVVARELVCNARLNGYLLGDAHYDDNALHERCRERGVQMLAARRAGTACKLGHIRHSPGRLRAVALLESSTTGFGSTLLAQRAAIETYFGHLSSAFFGLGPLPAWVRRQPRVWRWVTAKLFLFSLLTRRRKQSA